MEFMLTYEIGGGFIFDTNATIVPTSKFQTGENQGNRLPYAPKLVANMGLNYRSETMSSALTAHYRGEQFGDARNTIDVPTDAAGGIWGGLIPAHIVIDYTAQYVLNRNVTLFGAVKNLTDKRYITGFRQGIYIGAERTFELGINYRF